MDIKTCKASATTCTHGTVSVYVFYLTLLELSILVAFRVIALPFERKGFVDPFQVRVSFLGETFSFRNIGRFMIRSRDITLVTVVCAMSTKREPTHDV